MDFSKVKTIYLIGIKGVGMTMLAEFLVTQGYNVSGSDVVETFMTDQVLQRAGISVLSPFSKTNLPKTVDLVIYSLAYSEDTNEEIAEAKRQGFTVLSYAEALGEIFNTYRGVAIAGSHGKTTTTAWLGFVLQQAGKEPNVMVGARVPQFNGAGLSGKSHLLIIEADEYLNKLRFLKPKIVLLNNIDYDHPDFFPDEASYKKVFAEFIRSVPKSGVVIANADDSAIREIIQDIEASVITYGIDHSADYQVTEISFSKQQQFFRVITSSSEPLEPNETTDLGQFAISLSGPHNISNALAVIVASIEFGLELVDIRRYLAEFKGTARRLELLGSFKGAIIIDDYAHHPTEIKATLIAIKQIYPDRRIRVIFHPHTFSRTKQFLKAFGQSFSLADEVVVLDIYSSARESVGNIDSQRVVEELGKNNVSEAKYIPTLAAVETYIRETVQAEDIIILMGAGDVFRVGQALLQE